MTKKDGKSTRKPSEIDGIDLIIFAGSLIMAVLIGVFVGNLLNSHPDDWNPHPEPIYSEQPYTKEVVKRLQNDEFLDACSGNIKTKIQYSMDHQPDLYEDLRRTWHHYRDARMMDPFEACQQIDRDWGMCYSDSFDGTWMC